MQTHRSSGGFTLIELLVVIAIIGILSSVVLASLNTARSKGNDAAVKSNLNNARAQAELFYDANSNKYVGTIGTANDLCNASASANGVKGIYSFIEAAAKASNSTPNASNSAGSFGKTTCHATPSSGSYNPLDAWAIEAPLKGEYDGIAYPMYCIDSSGTAKVYDVLTASGTRLAAGDAKCS